MIPNLGHGNRRYLEIAQFLADQITQGKYAVGDRLPPERNLAQTLSVSRTTVREALLALEIMKYIEIKVGAGVFVLDEKQREQPALPELESISPMDVLAARRLIEGETAALAATATTPGKADQLERELNKMQKAIDDVPAFDEADARFHEIIANMAGNDLLMTFVSSLWRMRESAMWSRWYAQTRNRPNRMRAIQDHEDILRAIRRGLPDVARTAMQSHLDILVDRFFQLKL
jgi:DNA-binding FadR family transcriptional regulator